jgi:hypothetical protein
LVINGNLYAQTYKESFVACGKSYTAKLDVQNDNSIKININDGIDFNKSCEYIISTNDLDVFANSFKQHFIALRDSESGCASNDTDRIISYGRKLYLDYLASLSDTSSPIAGVIKVQDSTIVHVRLRIAANGKTKIVEDKEGFVSKVNKVQIEVSEGFITNLKASITYQHKQYQFILPFSVGISSVGNLKKYNICKLYEMNSLIHFKSLTKAQKNTIKTRKYSIIDSSYYILLNDLIVYDYKLEVDRRDYSPSNQFLSLEGGLSKILNKAPTNKLFEAHIFTDFIGLNEEKPNGLVQTEVSKRINVNSVQRNVPPLFYGLIKSIGIFQYISPSITFSKIEQHNKWLVLGNLDSIRNNPGLNDTSKFDHTIHSYSTALDLFQHQSFSAGFDLNVFFINNNDLKYSLDINFGARLGITQVNDSLSATTGSSISKPNSINNFSINTLQFYPEIILKFLPEERFNFSLAERAIYYKPFNPNLQLLEFKRSDQSKFLTKKATWLNSLQMLMTIQANENSKLFGKVVYNSDWKNFKDNFAQVQVGYSTFILGNRK